MKHGLAVLTLRIDDRETGIFIERAVDMADLGSAASPEDFLYHTIVVEMIETMLKTYFRSPNDLNK